ncbi:MAG TPA: aldehyde dehydrogenase family protein [Candidatus Baltobacteraceae bacterium]|nr:aldehyde dehydrogenase family protein [Candidatus Baltobacteraceae bacterium]
MEASIPSGNATVHSPIDGSLLASIATEGPRAVQLAVEKAKAGFAAWSRTPAPRRGELVRRFGEELRKHKTDLAHVISLEVGKIASESLGEVQEMIDICDFAIGLSRQLYGRTIASERADHALRELWHPLGVVAVITAFNFPGAVWAWNAALALICGDAVIWKPSEKAPLTALASSALLDRAAKAFGAPEGLHQIIVGDREAGIALVENEGVALVSATGSTTMGRDVGTRVARRFGRSLLELGGNNAMIVTTTADLDLALQAIVFGAAGTAGQRCTTLRRLLIHETVYEELVDKIKSAYARISIGNPLEDGTLVGPLIDARAFDRMTDALTAARREGGIVFGGRRVLEDRFPHAFYVEPALVEMPGQTEIVRQETFAPILYVTRYQELREAIEANNGVRQGLSSAIVTRDLAEAETFMSAQGSDCGIVNVNTSPSGAEIGGAFGGEKETGGGRESGSDCWKSYMRRVTTTVNYASGLVLSQGVDFMLKARE